MFFFFEETSLLIANNNNVSITYQTLFRKLFETDYRNRQKFPTNLVFKTLSYFDELERVVFRLFAESLDMTLRKSICAIFTRDT